MTIATHKFTTPKTNRFLHTLSHHALLKWGVILFIAISLQACSSQNTPKKRPAYLPGSENMNADQLLAKARELIKTQNQKQAIRYYETIEARYPLSDYAQQAILETAHSQYKNDEPDDALDTIDRFIRVYPASKNMDYALYLRGLVNFNRGKSLLDKVFPRNFADLDGVRHKESFHDLSRLVTRYPNSRYASDAKARILHLRNTIADSEMNVAEYYYQRGAYLAAFNRAEYTIKHYDGSPAVILALKMKVKAANAMGKPNVAAVSKRVLEANFPDM